MAYGITLSGHRGVEVSERHPFFRQVILVENGLRWTFGNTRFAVDAIVGMDVKHPLPFVEAIRGTDDDAVGVFAPETRLGDDVCHQFISCLSTPVE
jgi:hypothetical protein